jgi:opacity protein-like surface antigen
MKKLIVLLIAALTALSTLDAQVSKTAPKPAAPTTVEPQEMKPAAKAGATSLNFTFAGLGAFGIGPAGVNGGISVSFFLSNDAAVRLGLQGVLNSSKQPWNDLTPNGTNPGSDGTASTFGLGVGADYLMYVSAITPRVKPYFGAGVFVTMNSSDTKPALSNAVANGTITETKNGNGNEGLSFGVAGMAGAEFFLYPEISVSAEYQLTLFSMTSKSDKVVSFQGNPDVTTKQGSSTQILGFKTFGATLHIYF